MVDSRFAELIVYGAPILIGVYFWARWISRKYGAPRWTRYLAWGSVSVWAAPNLFAVWRVTLLVDSTSPGGVSAADRRRDIVSGITQAMYASVFANAMLVVAVGVLLFLTWRLHWAAKVPVALDNPPYR